MPVIRIPDKDWGKVWRELVASGPISRISQERVYAVSDEQVKLLRRKKLPFDVLDGTNQQKSAGANGQVRPPL